jgi:Sulfotransferase domain
MSIFKNRTAFEVARKLRAFLRLDKSLVPHVPWDKSVRQQIASKNREIVALRRKLTQVRGAAVRLPDPSAESMPLFFVVGYQKSGTTWLMKMLDFHPEILCQGEGRPFGRNWRQEHLRQRRVSYPPTSLYNAILSSEDLRYWIERSVWSRRGDKEQHLNNLTRLAIEYFLTRQLSKTGKRLVGDKTVLLSPEIIEEISAICPKAKVIHVMRDGRDVAISSTHHGWNQAEDQGGTSKLTPERLAKREAYRKDPQMLLKTGEGIFPDGELSKSAARWRARVRKTVKDGPALLGANYGEVRYEDLLEKPEEELRRLLKFLGADASEQIVRKCVSAASFEKLAGGRKRGQEAASFFRKGIAGDWKSVFTEQNKQDFKASAGDLLIELGYEEDNNW